MEILWKGNPISCMRSFGQLNCSLCMKERLAILDEFRKNPTKLINSQKELYGSCRHRTRFHRYCTCESTDDGLGLERVVWNGRRRIWQPTRVSLSGDSTNQNSPSQDSEWSSSQGSPVLDSPSTGKNNPDILSDQVRIGFFLTKIYMLYTIQNKEKWLATWIDN